MRFILLVAAIIARSIFAASQRAASSRFSRTVSLSRKKRAKRNCRGGRSRRTRIEAWLQTYLHVEDSEYVRAIGPRYLISAVARIYRPGCKADHVLVLEGPQGRLKSELLRTLARRDEWFSDRLSHVASKDAMLEVAGVWLIEIAEMDALTRATSSTMKRFLTHRHDRYRPPYGRHMTSLPRQCV